MKCESEAVTGADTPHCLTDDLQSVLNHADGKPIKVRELVEVLRERGLAMVLMVVTFPFLLPVPTMGLSAPTGAAVALFGICVMLSIKPWLPQFIAKRELSYHFLERMVRFGMKTVRPIERLLKPRMKFMMWPGLNIVLGISLVLCGFYLSLPLPIPFSNAVPAAAVLLILAGLMERDGAFVIAGQVLCLALTGLFGFVVYLIAKHGWAGTKKILRIGSEGSEATTQQAFFGVVEWIGCVM